MANVTRHNRRTSPRIDNSFGKYAPDVVARPVDTFFRTQAPSFQFADADRNYSGLAASLSGLAPALQRFLKERHDEKVARDEATGERLYYETGGHRLSWHDFRLAENERLKETGVSVSVKNGYLKARMTNEANAFREALNKAYNEGEAKVTLPDGTEIPVADSDDPSVFTLWMNRFTQDYVHMHMGKDVDPEYFAKIFVPSMESAEREMQSKHIAARNEHLKTQTLAEHSRLVEEEIRKLIKDGGFDMNDENLSSVKSRLENTLRELTLSGVDAKTAREAVIQQLITMAHNPDIDNGEDLFDIARDVKLPDGSSLWDNGPTAYELTIAAERIRKERRYRDREKKEEEEEAKREKRKADVAALAIAALHGRAIPDAMRDSFISEYGPDVYSALTSNVRNIKNGMDPTRVSAGGGGGGGGRRRGGGGGGGGGSVSKEAKASFMTKVVMAHKTGNPFALDDVLRHPVFGELSYTQQNHIYKLYEEQGKNVQEWRKEGGREALKIIGNILTDSGFIKDTPEYDYLTDAALVQTMANCDDLIAGSDPSVIQSDLSHLTTVKGLARQAAKDVLDNKELFTLGQARGLDVTDIKGMKREKEKEAVRAQVIALKQEKVSIGEAAAELAKRLKSDAPADQINDY